MNSAKLLHQHYALGTKIMLAEREIADLREKATAIGSFDYAKDRVKSSSPMGARYERLIERLVDRQAKLTDLMAEWMEQREAVADLIDLVEDTNQHEVLYFWYVLHLNAEQIAREMHYTPTNIYLLRRKGLLKIDELLNKFK